MNPFDYDQLVALGTEHLPRLSELIGRMAAATSLGAFLAFRAWRAFMPLVSRPSLQSAQAQTLIATAGAVMVVVIGDHPARAFGLVGLGSFIRFRSGISDPRDAAVMFVMIGIGMACGLGLFAMATASTLFICVLLTMFDALRHRITKRTIVTINSDDALSLRKRVEQLFASAGVRILEAPSNAPELAKDSGKLVIELDLHPRTDASALFDQLTASGVTGIRRVALMVEE
ncbi:MAG: hypothetical protein JWN48_4962 [Myxococcaceae bacterium]|nr:hypothetical protein [Myxococcaceae bacterium]